jgi:hypothetical protein
LAVPLWVILGQAVAVQTAMGIAFYVLARRQRDDPWLHALLVAAFSWLVSLPINVLAMGQPVAQWLAGAFFMLIPLGLGVGLATLRGRSGSDAAPSPPQEGAEGQLEFDPGSQTDPPHQETPR